MLDPILVLLETLRTGDPLPLPFVVAHGADPLRSAWEASEDPFSMLALVFVSGREWYFDAQITWKPATRMAREDDLSIDTGVVSYRATRRGGRIHEDYPTLKPTITMRPRDEQLARAVMETARRSNGGQIGALLLRGSLMGQPPTWAELRAPRT
jgi:hypothetical protein